MGYITQTTTQIGTTLSGLTNYNTIGQAVFSIGWKYLFASANSSQLDGNLIRVDESTGAPIELLNANHRIVDSTFPTTSYGWNSGTAIHVTTVDGITYMYIRWDAWNNTNVYRGTWDEGLKQFTGFSVFATMSYNVSGANYNNMARLDDNKIRLVSDAEAIFEFDVRTGTAYNNQAVGGTWSPSSYPFANTFVPLADQNTILGASGDGLNWYYQTGISAANSFNPTTTNTYADGFVISGASAWNIHPSTHFPVSYVYPNNGTISAYQINGVYIQTGEPLTSEATNVKIFSATLNATMMRPGDDGKFYFEYGTSTSYGTSVESKSAQGAGNTMSFALPGLAANTTYHYRAYIMQGGTKLVGADKTFKTKSGHAIVQTDPVTSILADRVTGNATITSLDQ